MATDPETAKRRQEVQRGLMVDLMDLDASAQRLEADLVAWKMRWRATYLELDEAMDRE